MRSSDIVRNLCKERGISIRQLEIALGFSNGSIANSNDIMSERLYKIAQYFNVPMEYLITGEMTDEIVKYTGGLDASLLEILRSKSSVRDLVRLGGKMSDTDIERLIDFVKNIQK